ncbi:hypothetical protein N9E90_04375, partial [Akkermansiaceae bacterium]|nr:hypothetical protein [Akkermansiaceae bacterium]
MTIVRPLLIGSALTTSIHAQTTFIDSSFDGVANDTNGAFEILSNTQANGSGASWDQVTGLVNRGTTNASTAGAVSATTVDIPTLGASAPIILTVDFESTTGALRANGIFVGFQEAPGGANAGVNLWNNADPAFGVVIDGSSRLGAYVVAPGGNSSTGAFQDSPAFGTTTLASFNDGFTVTLSVDPAGWEITLTGLKTSGAAPITGGSGTWADVAFDFSDFTSGMRVAFTTQGNGGGSLDLASVTVVSGGLPDTDMDGMSDAYETANGTNVSLNDAALDQDGDGLSNLQEFLGHNSSDLLTGFGQTLSGTADSDGDNLDDGDEVNGT